MADRWSLLPGQSFPLGRKYHSCHSFKLAGMCEGNPLILVQREVHCSGLQLSVSKCKLFLNHARTWQIDDDIDLPFSQGLSAGTVIDIWGLLGTETTSGSLPITDYNDGVRIFSSTGAWTLNGGRLMLTTLAIQKPTTIYRFSFSVKKLPWGLKLSKVFLLAIFCHACFVIIIFSTISAEQSSDNFCRAKFSDCQYRGSRRNSSCCYFNDDRSYSQLCPF